MNERSVMLNHTLMTPMERAAGRFMRAPDHPGAGDFSSELNQGGGENNSSVNPGANQNSGDSNNNSGQEFKPEAFWTAGEQPKQEETNGADGQAFGTQLMQSLAGLAFANLVDDKIATDLSEGKWEGFNQRLVEQQREAVKHSLALNVSVMQRAFAEMQNHVNRLIEEKLGSRDAQHELVKEIPQAGNPALKPLVDSIFNQAMKLNPGNRAAAIKMTKDMLAHTATTVAPDLGLAPRGPGDPQQTPPTNWLQELLAPNS